MPRNYLIGWEICTARSRVSGGVRECVTERRACLHVGVGEWRSGCGVAVIVENICSRLRTHAQLSLAPALPAGLVFHFYQDSVKLLDLVGFSISACQHCWPNSEREPPNVRLAPKAFPQFFSVHLNSFAPVWSLRWSFITFSFSQTH